MHCRVKSHSLPFESLVVLPNFAILAVGNVFVPRLHERLDVVEARSCLGASADDGLIQRTQMLSGEICNHVLS